MIRPIQDFVYVEFQSKHKSIIMPDGKKDPDCKTIVLAVGPNVPQNPPLEPGMEIQLRGNAQIHGIDDTSKTACVEYKMIMGIVDTDKSVNDELLKLINS